MLTAPFRGPHGAPTVLKHVVYASVRTLMRHTTIAQQRYAKRFSPTIARTTYHPPVLTAPTQTDVSIQPRPNHTSTSQGRKSFIPRPWCSQMAAEHTGLVEGRPKRSLHTVMVALAPLGLHGPSLTLPRRRIRVAGFIGARGISLAVV